MGDNMLMESDKKFGYIVLDANEALFGTQCGENHEVLHKFSIDLPIPTKRIKGLSAFQFSDLRTARRRDYLRKTSELANQYFISPSTSQPNVAGLILAYSTDFASFCAKLDEFDMLDPRLEVLDVLDVSNGVENGFIEAIELATNVKFIREKHLVGKYLDETRLDTGEHAIDVDCVHHTMNVLESKPGAFKTLIVWEKLDINRYVMKNRSTGEIVIKYLNKEQEDNIENFKELDVEEKMPLSAWLVDNSMRLGCALELVTDKTKHGNMFCTAFGGIGGLRNRVDFEEDEALDEDDDF